ncbi:hypothetical protein GGI20_001229 [Coemansia sp. BCRC 34301]|nr:hypothetical protein GGI20_001229 [Coemansia sp. BCRC 34301]
MCTKNRQLDAIKELSDIFEPDMYNGRLHYMASINVLLANHSTAAAAGSDDSSVLTAHSLSKRRNSGSSSCSSAETSHADFDDFELVDYDAAHSQSQDYLIHKSGRDRSYSPYPATAIARAKSKSHRRRRSSFSKLRGVVGGLLSNRPKN